jgi:hypothetical protein
LLAKELRSIATDFFRTLVMISFGLRVISSLFWYLKDSERVVHTQQREPEE